MSTTSFAEIMFTPAVQAQQEHYGSRRQYARMQAAGDPFAGLGEAEGKFLAQADGFFVATVSETGWPYVQHRGGPRGFVKILSPSQIAFADFRGNRQYVTVGNTSQDGRVAIIVMDHAHQRRLKLLGTLRFVEIGEADPALVQALQLPGYRAQVERVAIVDVAAADWNCPQHITQRFTIDEVETATQPLRDRIAELEAKLSQRAA
jgi:predicted pyridoxine 5'-phosphate oxidase superfamily flavin-nucleotide-binding protein